MDMIRLEFPADRLDIASAFGAALTTIGASTVTAADTQIAVTGTPDATTFAEFEENLLRSLATNMDLSYEQLVAASVPNSATVVPLDGGSDDNGQFTPEELKVDPTKLDMHGVAFNAEFCGKAAKPFYASGPRTGQWKKRQGVTDSAYDEWYAAEFAKVSPDSEPSQVNTASAFGGQQQQQQGPPIPHDAGTLMAWISEMQTAGRITQDQVNAAYQQAQLTMMDIFPGEDKTPEVIKERVGLLHGILMSWMS